MAAPLARAVRLARVQAVLTGAAAGGARRAALAAATLLVPVAVLAIASVLARGDEAGALGELRAWCVGAEPDALRETLVVALPLAALAACLALARAELAALARERPQALVARGVLAAALTGACVVALAASSDARAHVAPAPLGSRPQLDAPLVDQDGTRVRVADLRGGVVLATAFYARCSTTCPMTFAQVHRVLGALPRDRRERLAFVAVTLDPEHDRGERLAEIARGHGFAAPGARLLTGGSEDVGRTLDALGIARRRDRATGLVEHEGVLLVLDAGGHVAGRFPAVEASEAPLLALLRELLAEGAALPA